MRARVRVKARVRTGGSRRSSSTRLSQASTYIRQLPRTPTPTPTPTRTVAGSILDVDGNVVADDSYLTDCTDFIEVRIAPMPTYPHERVSEWTWVSESLIRAHLYASPPQSASPPANQPYLTRPSTLRNPHLPNHLVLIAMNAVPLRRIRWYAWHRHLSACSIRGWVQFCGRLQVCAWWRCPNGQAGRERK